MLDWLRRLIGPATMTAPNRHVRASFDNVSPDGRMNAYWANADAMSAKSANSPDVRQKFRNRSRYEYANNSYCQGITLTIANELIGRGPRLQMRLPDNRDANRQLERLWASWGSGNCFNEKLHVMAQAMVRDGEAPGRLFFNGASRSLLQLDLEPFEAERLASPTQPGPNEVDGIRFDEWGNPVAYAVLSYHPGDGFRPVGSAGFDWIDAKWMVHWFRADRPGQVRGLPWVSSCLGLFAQLRRWTLAVLTSAETAANFSAILYSEQSPETAQPEPMDQVPIGMGMMTTLPGGWKMGQFAAEQPQAQYESFKKELLKEIARCLNMPLNVVTGDSSGYNYASGRLDYQNWHRTIKVSRSHFERTILERIFAVWLDEVHARGLLPAGVDLADVPHGWFWDAVPHVDPVKDGTGDALALVNRTDTLANICASQGLDWEEVLEQQKREQDRIEELGLIDTSMPQQPATDTAPPPVQDASGRRRFWDHVINMAGAN